MGLRAAFFHDHVFRQLPSGEVYSPGRLPYGAFKRYLAVFNELTVVGRVRGATQGEAGLVQASGPGVVFRLDHGYRGPLDAWFKGRELRCFVDSVVDGVDCVVARLPSELGLLAAGSARRRGKLLAVEVVASASQSYRGHGGMVGRLYGPIMERRTARAVGDAEFAIYVTRCFLQGSYPCHGITSNASNVELESREASWLEDRLARLATEADPAVLGFVGSLQGRHKGLDLALRATQLLLRRGVPVVLRCVGDGPSESWQRVASSLGIARQVTFEGPLAGSGAVQAWMRTLDCLLHPSRAEGLPRAVIESMWVACPVVGSAAGGTPELLDREALCPVGDYRSLAEVAERMLASASFAGASVRRNWAAAEQFEARAIERVRAEVWRRIAGEAARRGQKVLSVAEPLAGS